MNSSPCALQQWVNGCLIGLLLPLLTGCETAKKYSLTYRLWDSADMRRFNEPASNPQLELSQSSKTNVVLVQYDEVRESNEAVKRRAYFLFRDEQKIKAGRKPTFISPEKVTGLKPVPLVYGDLLSTNVPAMGGNYATTSTNSHRFTLQLDGHGKGPYELPVYERKSGQVQRTVLTPFALAGDVVMVGFVAAFVALVTLCAGGASFGT